MLKTAILFAVLAVTSARPRQLSCATERCGPGQTCVLRQVYCFAPPCYPQPTCVRSAIGGVPRKPGVCRAPRTHRPGSCASSCYSDVDCTGAYKCCRSACGGRSCQYPSGIPNIPSCANVRCGLGQICVLRQVYCFTTPCYPQPTCVAVIIYDNPCDGGPAVGNCRGAIPRWFFDSRHGICRQFKYGGCGGSSNNYESEESCQKNCLHFEASSQ